MNMRLFKKKNDVKKSSEKIGEFKMDHLPDDQHDGEYENEKDTNDIACYVHAIRL